MMTWKRLTWTVATLTAVAYVGYAGGYVSAVCVKGCGGINGMIFDDGGTNVCIAFDPDDPQGMYENVVWNNGEYDNSVTASQLSGTGDEKLIKATYCASGCSPGCTPWEDQVEAFGCTYNPNNWLWVPHFKCN